MERRERLTELFQQDRSYLRAVAYRMLGSLTEADDALQEAWLRLRDQNVESIENTRAWLRTVVARVCLNMLRSRRRRNSQIEQFRVPDPVVTLSHTLSPEQQALLADSVGLALMVVLDALTPAERLAFVLHDVFGASFAEIAPMLERSEAATMQLASRARRHVRDAPTPDPDVARQRSIVDAFFAAARDGDFEALVHLLDPDVVLRIDGGKLRRDASVVLRGAEAVAAHTRTYSGLHPFVVPALVNGTAGVVIAPHGEPYAVMAFTVITGRITTIEAIADPERLQRLPLHLPR